jgi:hypothetical protein
VSDPTTRDYVIQVRVNATERERIARRADANGMKVAEYARARLLAEEMPDALAAANAITNHLAGLESAVRQARRALGREE